MRTNDTLILSTTALANFPTNGTIGTAATTVDAVASFGVAQATAGVALTLPTPTTPTAGQRATVSNTGSVPFSVNGATIGVGDTADFTWVGSAWGTGGVGAKDFWRDTAGNKPNADGTDAATSIVRRGNVGINVTSPSSALTVGGDIALTGRFLPPALTPATAPNFAIPSNNRLTFGETFAPPNDAGTVISFASGSGARNMVFAFGKTTVHTSFFADTGGSTVIGTEAATPIIFRNGMAYGSADVATSGVERMRLDSSGFLGVGTDTPMSTLHVGGSVSAAVTTVTAATTLTNAHNTVFAAGATAFAITLPTAASALGRSYRIKTTGVAKTISQYLDMAGNPSTALPINATVTVVSDGAVWHQV